LPVSADAQNISLAEAKNGFAFGGSFDATGSYKKSVLINLIASK